MWTRLVRQWSALSRTVPRLKVLNRFVAEIRLYRKMLLPPPMFLSIVTTIPRCLPLSLVMCPRNVLLLKGYLGSRTRLGLP